MPSSFGFLHMQIIILTVVHVIKDTSSTALHEHRVAHINKYYDLIILIMKIVLTFMRIISV